MTMTNLIVAIALFAVAMLDFAVRSRRMRDSGKPVPVDFQAFRTLKDRDDELFLRAKLPHREFTRLKRLRIGVTWKYVGRIANNMAIVLHNIERPQQNTEPEDVQVRTETVNMAIQVRMNCMVSLAKLAVEFVFPSMQLNPATPEPKYEAVRENLRRLGSLEPHSAVPLANVI